MALVKMNIFGKIVLLIFLLLIPIILLYSYSNHVSVHVVEEEIQTSSLNQLTFFLHQVDTTVDQLSMFPVILSNDPYIREYVDQRPKNFFDSYKMESKISEKLSLQSVSSNWTNDLTLYLPTEKKTLSSNLFISYNESYVRDHMPQGWTYEKGFGFAGSYQFVRQIVVPTSAKGSEQVNAMIQIAFSTQNIVHMLDQFKQGNNGDPFLFHPVHTPIQNSTSSNKLVDELIPLIKTEVLHDSGKKIIELSGTLYLVTYVKSKSLDWFLIDYVPLEQILSPITESRKLFYSSLGLLLILSILASFLLYRHVQIPIKKLVLSLQRMKNGDFSTRIQYRPNNEFGFLITRFNDMAEQIQELIKTVYIEKIHSREATLKQLQSQINPHFLYNCLFFIVNTAKIDDKESVIAMAHNLGEYFRYTTRVEKQLVSVREEIKLVTNYLTIQNLRMQCIQYKIAIPDQMMDLLIPRLSIQPIVENAIVHGFEKKITEGVITITAEYNDYEYRIIIEDNGVGMSSEALRDLQRKIESPMEEKMGCGLWNVHQRLIYRFGEGAGLQFSNSPTGGLKVIFRWEQLSNATLVKAEL